MGMDDEDRPFRQVRQGPQLFADTCAAHRTAADTKGHIRTEGGAEAAEFGLCEMQLPEAVEAAQYSGTVCTAAGEPCGDGDAFFKMDVHAQIVLFIRTKCLPGTIGQIRPVTGQAAGGARQRKGIAFFEGNRIGQANRLEDGVDIVITIGTTAGDRQSEINFSVSCFYYFRHI